MGRTGVNMGLPAIAVGRGLGDASQHYSQNHYHTVQLWPHVGIAD
jgi:hypothetical protein